MILYIRLNLSRYKERKEERKKGRKEERKKERKNVLSTRCHKKKSLAASKKKITGLRLIGILR
jgi:hypothetical protein